MALLAVPVNGPHSTCAIGVPTSLPQTKSGLATWSAVAFEQRAEAAASLSDKVVELAAGLTAIRTPLAAIAAIAPK
jgi:hypothetical protein